jgi:excinuclease UvrABC helicase subunit UvrB
MVTSNGLEDVEVECTAGDGIALSIVYGCPLYASKEVLDISVVHINDDGSQMSEDEMDVEEDFEEIKPAKRVVSIEDLEHMMNDAIANEEYEIAAEIRDRINKLKGEQ